MAGSSNGVKSRSCSNFLVIAGAAALWSALVLSCLFFVGHASAAPAPAKTTTTTHRRPHTTTTARRRMPVFAPAPIPAPRNLAVYKDDRAAVLSYDSRTNMSLNYRIVWGPVDGSAPNNTAYWPYEKFQVQPLTPGVRYFAVVQSIGVGTKNFGNLSLPAGPVYFASDSARVDSIRKEATGFFDDFNTSPGDFDQGKWDTSYGKCAEPLYSATFINGQSHAHNAVRNVGDCANTTSVDARPRTMFDFTGRTGKVFFDFDGPQAGNYWFLNFNRAPYFSQDSQMREALGYRAPPSGSVNEFFIHLRQDRAQFHPFGDSRNFTVDLCKLDQSLCKVINVRRRFVAEISKSTFKLTVNGKLAMSVSGLSLPFEKATLSFKQRGSRQQRADSDFVTVHWDNFGFDGPASPVLTRNFRSPAFLDASWKKLSTLSPANTVSIPYSSPVPVGKVLGARFMYRLTPSNGSLAWSKLDYIQLNGLVNLPIFNQSLWKPNRDFNKTFPDSNGRGGPTYHFIVPLTADQASKLVLGGSNTFKFVIVNDAIITQAHLEVDYEKTGDAGDALEQRPQTFYTLSPPSYHPASSIKVGPILRISSLGNLSTDIPCLYPDGIETGLCYDAPTNYPGYPKLLLSPGPVFTQTGGLNGVYDLRYRVRPSNSVSSFGKSIPIANVTVYIDNKVVYTQVFPKTIVQYYGSWKLDTKTLSKGAHTVSIQAWDADGTPSWQDYAQYSSKGVVYPVYFTVA